MTTTEAEVTTLGASSATPSLNKALSQLQGELPKVTKGKEGAVSGVTAAGAKYNYKYSYADLADVTDAVGPLLAKYGLAFHAAPTINPADRREMILIWSLLHESGEDRTGEWPLGPANQKPQSLGSAITYARRYCLCAATGIAADDDDDAAAAQNDTRQGDAWENSKPAPPRKPAPPKDSRSWADIAIEKAGTFKTEAEGVKLWREAAERHVTGDCTKEKQDHIQNRVTDRITARRTEAMERLLRNLSESDDWRDHVRGLTGDEDARAALEELGRLKADGGMDPTRAGRIGAAVIARWPRATLVDTEATA